MQFLEPGNIVCSIDIGIIIPSVYKTNTEGICVKELYTGGDNKLKTGSGWFNLGHMPLPVPAHCGFL